MLNKKIKVVLVLIAALTIIITCSLLIPPKILTKENNKGNEFDQLDRLMNTTRYAEQVRKAGYKVDDYDLKMMDRIPELQTKGEVKFIIQSPTDAKEIFVYIGGYRNRITFDKNMNINSSAIDQGKDKPSRHATEEEKTKYEKEIKEEINKLLDDVYKAEKE